MGKSTQKNAANAEESVSAFEEMSTQAQQMKTFVYDLVAVVGGASHNLLMTGAHGRAAPPAAGAGEKRGRSAIDIERPAPNQNTAKPKHPNPEKIIPLDDDFKDF